MAIITKQKFVVEDIIDENGDKVGEIKFNPSDSRIMKKMAIIVEEVTSALDEIKKLGVKELNLKKIEINKNATYEDYEEIRDDIKKLCDAYKIEDNTNEKIIEELSEIFGKENIDLITCGSNDIELLLPLIDMLEPYVKEARSKKMDKYMPKNNDDVME